MVAKVKGQPSKTSPIDGDCGTLFPVESDTTLSRPCSKANINSRALSAKRSSSNHNTCCPLSSEIRWGIPSAARALFKTLRSASIGYSPTLKILLIADHVFYKLISANTFKVPTHTDPES